MRDEELVARRSRLVTVAIAAVSVLVYLGTVDGQYPLDDAVQVLNNVYVRNLGGALDLFSRASWPGNLYRPLPAFTYALTYALVGLNPWLYHLTSVLLHAIAAVLVLWCLRRVFDDRLAAIAALLFAVHPVHVEAVASIANRTELLVAVFGLGGLLIVLPPAEGRARSAAATGMRIVLGGLCFLLALLAKESALVLLLLLPLLVATRKEARLRGAGARRAFLRDLWPGLLALTVAIAAYLLQRSHVVTRMLDASAIAPIDNWLVGVPALERVPHALALLGRYVSILVLPTGLSADHSSGIAGKARDLLAPDALFHLGLTAAVVVGAAVGWRRAAKPLLFCAGWFLASFAVTSNLAFPIGVAFADRLAYLPSIAICALLALLLVRIASAPLRYVAVAGVAGVFALLTISYGGVWHDNQTLLLYELRTSPQSAWAHAGLGNELLHAGAYAPARAEYLEALRLYPKHAHAAHGLAVIELAENDRAEGRAWLERALEFDPTFAPTLNTLGFLELEDGHVDAAGRLFVRALNADNDNVDARVGILAATLQRGNLDQAARLRDELMALDATRGDVRRLSADLDRLSAARAMRAVDEGAPG